jgi:hypothetical protein
VTNRSMSRAANLDQYGDCDSRGQAALRTNRFDYPIYRMTCPRPPARVHLALHTKSVLPPSERWLRSPHRRGAPLMLRALTTGSQPAYCIPLTDDQYACTNYQAHIYFARDRCRYSVCGLARATMCKLDRAEGKFQAQGSGGDRGRERDTSSPLPASCAINGNKISVSVPIALRSV